MSSKCIRDTVSKVKTKYQESDPYRLAAAMHIIVKKLPLGTDPNCCKGFCMRECRKTCIVINCDLPEIIQQIILIHEIGHALLHQKTLQINHIIFNAASFVDHHKYVSNKRSYHKICRISNRICHENGLATSMPTGEKGKSYKENMEYHRGTSWKAKLRVAVDKAIWTSINYEEFLQKMQLAGYEVRQGKHLSFCAPEQKNFTYMKSLGSYYSEENVRIRLAKNRNKIKAPRHLSREARLYINISTYVTTGNREGFERWAKLNNLKEAARTFNYLSENNLLNYEDFQQHVSDVDASVKAADQRITQINSELSTQKIIQKHCDSYRLCRKVIEDCKSAKNPKAYRTKHQAEYQLHDSLKKELQDLGVTKIPSSNKIQKRIENLESEQAATVREKQELQKKQKTLNIIRQNFTALLNAPEMQIPISEKELTL